MSVTILLGDCRVRMQELADSSVDSVVCDPPYHLTSIVKRFGAANAAPAKVGKTGAYARASKGFMGQQWDGGDVAFQPETWAEVLRVLKPGAHLVAFSGTRTYHRMACAIEDAGFEIRDQLAWIYGSGFPKSLDVSKHLDKMAGAERKVTRERYTVKRIKPGATVVKEGAWGKQEVPYTATDSEPATDAAREWQGWGTALKPSWESICLAQKPYDFRQLCAILARTITEALCQLPSLAKDAEPSSWLSLSVFAEGFGSAQWNAVAECNTPGALFALMATLPSASALPSSLSIALSWLNTLAALLERESMFTTETASSLTTDLRTLNSLLSKNTPLTIAQAAIPQSGEPSIASLAASLFNAVEARSRFTLGLSALDPATLRDHTSCQDEIAPNLSPICLARKPLVGTVAQNVLAHGTGALNIDGCRIPADDKAEFPAGVVSNTEKTFGGGDGLYANRPRPGDANPTARWPANLCHDGSEEVLAGFPDSEASSGPFNRRATLNTQSTVNIAGRSEELAGFGFGDSGSAARFFYCAKATTEERNAGCYDLAADDKAVESAHSVVCAKCNRQRVNVSGQCQCPEPEWVRKQQRPQGNNHPTVKPVALMRWLVRLVTPKGGTVLDPFMGSGSTLLAAEAEQFNAVGCEMSEEYAAIAERRLKAAGGMFAEVSVCMGKAA